MFGGSVLTTFLPVTQRMNTRKSAWRRSDWYTKARFEPKKDTINTQRDETTRLKMAAKYSRKEHNHLDSTIDARVQELLDLIHNKYISSRETRYCPMDWGQKSSSSCLIPIWTLHLGTPLGPWRMTGTHMISTG
jgi:hypothetical protein